MGMIIRSLYFMIIMINDTMMISGPSRFSADLPMRSPPAIGVRELTSCQPRPARGPCAVRITAPHDPGEVRMRSPQHVARSLQPFRVLTIATQRPSALVTHQRWSASSVLRQCFVSAGSRRHSSVLEYTPTPARVTREAISIRSPFRRSPAPSHTHEAPE